LQGTRAKVEYHGFTEPVLSVAEVFAKTTYAKVSLSGRRINVLPFQGTKAEEEYHVRLMALFASRVMQYWPHA
jgi:hypothetical protein